MARTTENEKITLRLREAEKLATQLFTQPDAYSDEDVKNASVVFMHILFKRFARMAVESGVPISEYLKMGPDLADILTKLIKEVTDVDTKEEVLKAMRLVKD